MFVNAIAILREYVILASGTLPKIIIFSDKIKIGIVEEIIRGVPHTVELPFYLGLEAKDEKHNDTAGRVYRG